VGAETATECEEMLEIAAEVVAPLSEAGGRSDSHADELSQRYASLVDRLGLRDDARRGSGTHTVVAALALSAAVGPDAQLGAVIAARAINTDTDTIATMAAAVSGAADDGDRAPDVLDADYI